MSWNLNDFEKLFEKREEVVYEEELENNSFNNLQVKLAEMEDRLKKMEERQKIVENDVVQILLDGRPNFLP